MNADFAKALAAFQAECPIVAKATEGRDGNRVYKYADLPSIIQQIQPLLKQHGLAFLCTPRMLDNGANLLAAMLIHRDSGETIEAHMSLNPQANIKQLGSEITYKRRYMLSAMLNLVTDEDDDGSQAGEAKTSKPDKRSTDPDWQGDKKKTALQDSVRELVKALEVAATLDDITVLTDSYAQVIEDCKINLPTWWEGQHRHGEFVLGLAHHIDNAHARVNALEEEKHGAGVVQ